MQATPAETDIQYSMQYMQYGISVNHQRSEQIISTECETRCTDIGNSCQDSAVGLGSIRDHVLDTQYSGVSIFQRTVSMVMPRSRLTKTFGTDYQCRQNISTACGALRTKVRSTESLSRMESTSLFSSMVLHELFQLGGDAMLTVGVGSEDRVSVQTEH